jgi:hypothetical protein
MVKLMIFFFAIKKSQFWGRGNLREGYLLEDPGIDERIILKCICKTWDGGLRAERGGGRF